MTANSVPKSFRFPTFALWIFLVGVSLVTDGQLCAQDSARTGVEVQDSFLGPTDAGLKAGFATPAEKKLDYAWIDSLTARGQQKVYRGQELHTIGMPCGGIGAGQLYVRGDGTLARWLVFGQHFSTHWGKLKRKDAPKNIGYKTYRPKSELMQGFALQVQQDGKETQTVDLSQKDFDNIGFVGEFPIAEIQYRRNNDPLPVQVDLEVFTPWIPLAPEKSGHPATVLRFTLTNTTDEPLKASLAGWLENGSSLENKKKSPTARLVNTIVAGEQLTFLSSAASPEKELKGKRDFGTMGLALLGTAADIQHAQVQTDALPQVLFQQLPNKQKAEVSASKTLVGSLGRQLTLAANETQTVTFFVTWHYPNYVNPDDRGKTGAVGRMYANWADDALGIANNLARDFDSLDQQTHLYRDTYYDTTLPYWFVQRIAMPSSTLSSLTSQWWKNGRFYNYEGVGFCAGTCTHVYAYAQAMARLFPSLERGVRKRQDLSDFAQDPKTGRINFRGRDHKLGAGIRASGYAADGQCPIIMKAYREHLMSVDNSFLDSVWPKVKLAMKFMIDLDAEDGKQDGMIERRQHTTWDTDMYGANTYIGALYLGALSACDEMATIQGDEQAAKMYRDLARQGTANTLKLLWNGDYFIQIFPDDVPVVRSSSWGEVAVSYDNGCFSNQLFGQNYASQLGLGYLYPQPMVRKTLRSVYRYTWLPDMKYLYSKGKPYPHYLIAHEGEAGMLQCAWPLDKRPINSVKLVEHVWSGFEYQVASHMLYEGLTEEGFAIIRGIHDRYDGVHHNPWNEIEGGDHYGRAMASWACLPNISGFHYNGPQQELGFAPRFQADDFKAFFSSAQGWGSLVQKRSATGQANHVEVKWGTLSLKTLRLTLPDGKAASKIQVRNGDQEIDFTNSQDSGELVLIFASPVMTNADGTLVVEVLY